MQLKGWIRIPKFFICGNIFDEVGRVSLLAAWSEITNHNNCVEITFLYRLMLLKLLSASVTLEGKYISESL